MTLPYRASTIRLLFALALAGCAAQPIEPTKSPAPKPAAADPAAVTQPSPRWPTVAREPVPAEPPQPVDPPPSKGAQVLAQGVKAYEDGDYRGASKLFEAALRETLTGKEQAIAYKYLAFVACVSGRTATCRAHFRKAFAAYASFELTPAEAGHPLWGPAFRTVKAEIEAKGKDARKPKAKPAPPAKPSR
jgi:hypothetical protein